MIETTFSALLACPACGFDAESQTTAAANLAIVSMVVVLFGVLSGFLGFIWKMARVERRRHQSETASSAGAGVSVHQG